MAAPATGIYGQLAIAEESTYGTPVTVTRFHEFNSESTPIVKTINRIEGKGVRSGARFVRSDRWYAGEVDVKGAFELELHNKGFGLWLKHCLGGSAIAQPDASHNTTVYQETFTPAALDGMSLTAEIGWVDTAGNPFKKTAQGLQVVGWEMDIDVGGLFLLKPEVIAQDLVDTTGVTTASYTATTHEFPFVEAGLTIGGTTIPVEKLSIKAKNALDDKRYFLGSGLRSEACEVDYRDVTFDISAEWADFTAYDRFISGTEASLVVTVQGALISNVGGGLGPYYYGVTLTSNVRTDGTTPAVNGRARIMQPITCKAIDTGSGAGTAFTGVYTTTDTAL